MTNAQPSNRADTPRSCPQCRATDNNAYETEYGVKMRACGRCMIQWVDKEADAAPAAPTPHPDTDICRECGEMRCHDNHFREHARGTVFHDFTPERRIEGAPTPQEHHKPCGSPTCVACSFNHVPPLYEQLSGAPTPQPEPLCNRHMEYKPGGGGIRCGKPVGHFGFCLPSDAAPMPVPAKEPHQCKFPYPPMSVNFTCNDCGTLWSWEDFGGWKRNAVERIETMPMKPRDVAWKSERCAKEFTMRNGRKGICDSYLGHFGLHSMLLHTSELHAAPSGAEEATPPNCDKNMGNDVLIIPCDLKKGHFGPCERNTWPVTESEQRLAVQKDAAMELFAVASEAYGYLSSLHRDAPKHSGAANIAPRLKEALDAFKAKPEYPKPCGICEGVIQSKDDLDWHGYGNCRDIPEPIMKQMAEAVPEPRPEPREPVMMVDPLAPDEPHELSPDCRQYGCKPAGELKERGKQ